MTRKRARERPRRAVPPEGLARRAAGPDRLALLAAIVPAGLAIVLALPTFSFTYLFDDYDFLGRAASFRPSQLLPDPGLLFYRPISREIYFGILYALDPNHPIWGRLANGAVLALSVALLGSIVTRLAGLRAGVAAALAFAALGATPVLVGWTSGCQDLLAILFILAALRAELSGKTLLALGAVACALLSKETAVALVPAVAVARWIAGGAPGRRLAALAGYAAVVVAWAAAHPGVRRLVVGRLESDEPGVAYLTLQGADRWASLGKGAATLVNWPVTGAGTEWPSGLNPTLAIAAPLVAFGLWKAWRTERAAAAGGSPEKEGRTIAVHRGRVVILALLLAVPPLLVISFLVENWQPYYLALAAIGTSMLAGVALSRMPLPAAAGAALVFLGLGIWCRGMDLGTSVLTERTVRPPMEQIRRVAASFRDRFQRLTGPAHVYLSVHTPRDPAVPLHLFRFQALRLWYRDRAIDTMHPEWRRPDPPSETLAWVAPDLSVHEIDVRTLATRPGGGDAATYEYGATLRAYAQGLASTGQVDRAVEILLTMQAPDGFVAALNRRLAAAFLLAAGRKDEAAALLRETPSIAARDAILAAGEILANPSRRDIDAPVLEALGVSPADTAATRAIMRALALGNRRGATIRFAGRLLDLKPGDWEAQALIRWLKQGGEAVRVTAPAVSDSLW